MIDGHLVIDFHGHVGRWDALDAVDDPEKMLRAMDAAGIDKSCVFNIFHPDGGPGNDATAAFVGRHPDRFIGFAYVSPTMPGTIRPRARAGIDGLGMPAIKIYPPYTPYPLDDPAWDPVYGFADERGLAVIAHTGGEPTASPELFGRAAARFPDAFFVAAHTGNIEPYRTQAIAAARANANYYLETCSTYRQPGVVERIVAEAGAERVIFGSDTPLMDPRPQLGKIVTADIDAAAKRLILGGNARRLLRL